MGSEEAKVALVTGGSRGIGAEIARSLVETDFEVVITGRKADQLQETANRLGTVALCGDVTEPGMAADVVESVLSRRGRLDVLVNNAGTAGPGGALLETDETAWWNVMRTNVYGPMAFMRAALPEMVRRRRGVVLNIGSYVAVRPTPGNAAYSASKAALARLTDSVAAEVSHAGVTVLSVSPGLVKTDMTRDVPVFEGLPASAWSPIEAIGETVSTLVNHPEVPQLSGRFLHVSDDLDRVLAELDRVQADRLLQPGMTGLNGPID